MRPSELPELRAKMVETWFEGYPEAYPDKRDSMFLKIMAPWRVGELFYVTAEMTQLAIAASRTMPPFKMMREDMPADHGIIYFDLPINDDPENRIVLCTWQQGVNDLLKVGAEVVFYSPRLKRDRVLWSPWDIGNIMLMVYDSDESVTVPGKDDCLAWAHVVRCAWLLMQQRVATVTDHLPDRASARRMQRAGRTATSVRVISLRRLEAYATGDHETHYRHRWVVRGHWRKQWYATQDRNIPIWISPYVKGPEGAPLLAGEKVYAWRR